MVSYLYTVYGKRPNSVEMFETFDTVSQARYYLSGIILRHKADSKRGTRGRNAWIAKDTVRVFVNDEAHEYWYSPVVADEGDKPWRPDLL